ncbi:hypothetical protein BJX64DRAFT_253134 [Aspergillus heterothallicus]
MRRRIKVLLEAYCLISHDFFSPPPSEKAPNPAGDSFRWILFTSMLCLHCCSLLLLQLVDKINLSYAYST